MPLPVATGAPTLFIRRAAYESSGLTRAAIDERLGLTADEFRVEEDLIAIGPIYEGRRRRSHRSDRGARGVGPRVLRRLLRAQWQLAGLAPPLRIGPLRSA